MFHHGVKNEKEMNVEAKRRMLLDHDELRGTSVSYDFSNSWANGRVTFRLRLWDSLFKLSFSYF